MPHLQKYFGEFGGMFVPQPIATALSHVEKARYDHIETKEFQEEVAYYHRHFVWRPTPLTYCQNLSDSLWWARIVLKREDMTCIWAHKINHALVQWLLAKRMWKKTLIAETWAGMHGVSTATVWAWLGMKVKVYMWSKDMERQAQNVQRMHMLWAEVIPAETWQKTLKDAINEAMKDWIANLQDSYYLLWSALWPYPYPSIVKYSQKIVWEEVQSQLKELSATHGRKNSKPHTIAACVWWWCNSIWIRAPYLDDTDVLLVWAEAWWTDTSSVWTHATRIGGAWAKIWVFHGFKSLFLQDKNGNIEHTASISAGLDYPWIWPEHAYLSSQKRATYIWVTDDKVLDAMYLLAQKEWIIWALESCHAVAYALEVAPILSADDIIVINLSWRWDKDLHTVTQYKANNL